MAAGSLTPGQMEVEELFPRYLLKGQLPEQLLADLQALAAAVLADPASYPDAAPKLAGQLALQRDPLPVGASLLQPLPVVQLRLRRVPPRLAPRSVS